MALHTNNDNAHEYFIYTMYVANGSNLYAME